VSRRLVASDLQRVGWECVHFAPEPPAPSVRSELDASEIAVVELDGGSIATDAEALGAVARALRFPDYFGVNWDALDECLRDLGDWFPAKGYVMVVRGAGALWQKAPDTAGMLVEVWLSAAEAWGASRTPFHLVFAWA